MSKLDIAESGAKHDLKWIESDYRFKPKCKELPGDFDPARLKLYRIDEITFEKDSPREEALSNVFTSIAIEGINVVYLLIGDKVGVRVYFGVVEEKLEKEKKLNILTIGNDILLKSLKGNFRGSTITPIEGEEIYDIYGKVFPSELVQERPSEKARMMHYRTMDGVPGLTKDKEAKSFQGMDRLIDAMQGDEFALMILAKPMGCCGWQMTNIERNLDEIYRKLTWASKCQYQYSENASTNKSMSVSRGVSDGVTEAVNNSKSQSDTFNWNDSKAERSSSKSVTDTKQGGWSQQNALSVGESVSANKGTSQQVSMQNGTQDGCNKSWGNEIVWKHIQGWLKYFDELIYPRLDRSKGGGLYVVSTLLASASLPVLTKLSNVMRAVYAGTEGNMVPFRDEDFGVKPLDSAKWKSLAHLQQPIWENLSLGRGDKKEGVKNDREFAYARCKCACGRAADGNEEFYDGTWMSSAVLSHLAGLPQKEVIGVKLREEVEFGLNIEPPEADEEVVELGSLVQSGEVKDGMAVFLKKSEFDRHMFVAGVTGSGKTTTCQQLLCDCVKGNGKRKECDRTHFLVIEPAKTEYRSLVGSRFLQGDSNDLLVFTLGDEINGAPFRLNPLEFSEGEAISSRVDMLMASMAAAFDMEAAIPQILESAIYRAYEDYGWDKHTNQNKFYPGGKAFEPGVYAFPCLSDVVRIAIKCVDDLFPGQDKRLHDEYAGSIRARLGGLLVGAKGQMLDCKRSMNFDELLNRNVVLELEEIRNGQQKALIIGFVLTNLLVAIKRKFDKTNRKIGHITLIEEAHRLMSRYQPGDDPNKRLAVETFADMLAEVRKYGESIIIADQIPNKLTPDVLKNTNIKIVHRIFAQDDRDEIGATMSLSDDQKNFLPRLKIGHAVAFSGSWPKAVHVCVPHVIDTSKQSHVTNGDLRKRAFRFLAEQYKTGVLPGFDRIKSEKTAFNLVEAYWRDVQTVDFSGVFEDEILGVQTPQNTSRREKVRRAIESCGVAVVASALVARYLPPDNVKQRVAAAESALPMFIKGETSFPKDIKRFLSTNKLINQ